MLAALPILMLSMTPQPRDSHTEWLKHRDWETVSQYWATESVLPDHERWFDETYTDGRVSLIARDTYEDSFNWHVSEERNRDKDRATYFITVGYDGQAFLGWQQQRAKEGGEEPITVAKVIRDALNDLLGAGTNEVSTLSVAGRTDRGVSALYQVCSFYTWEHTRSTQKKKHRKPPALVGNSVSSSCNQTSDSADSAITVATVRTAVKDTCIAHGLSPRAVSVHRLQRVPRRLHPRFSARWRRYAYLLPLNRVGEADNAQQYDISVAKMDDALRSLEGEALHYNALAFGRLGGAEENSDRCTLYRARASLVHLRKSAVASREGNERKVSGIGGPSAIISERHSRVTLSPSPSQSAVTTPAVLVELVGDRFLRRMVRVLVATAARLACASSVPRGGESDPPDANQMSEREEEARAAGTCSKDWDHEADQEKEKRTTRPETSLRCIIDGGTRSGAAHPAPACGLALIGIGYASDGSSL